MDQLKNIYRLLSFFLLSVLLLSHGTEAAEYKPCEPIGLKCEHLTDPLGVDAPYPRLMWRIDDNRQGAKQTAYRLVLAQDSMAVVQAGSLTWDTGKIEGGETLVKYAGERLKPLQRYFWKVIVWDKDGIAASSEVAVFETGMMGTQNWKGAWISDSHNIDHKPAPYFRKRVSSRKGGQICSCIHRSGRFVRVVA